MEMSLEERAAWASAPSPCVDVCKYKRQGRCIGCSMTKEEKQAFPNSGGPEAKRAFIEGLMTRLAEATRNPAFWAMSYRRKCEKDGVPCPIDFEGEGERG
ncbi:DUF1289 domain-containing protein [Aurantimonas sp. Leaf443]|uniref:DUF1289 domain-containing protein n=1 Tax=Aurantimonas sp. Leaf443 TaxID=1736378 RepID=UPI0006F58E25|nr:DUF1289 domain-containing protein [Aurantimonas sp. Leaf443]KQT88191.1 hypothetical protein ASG48_01765 [Aurantimonas sp. Leaf443]